MVVLAAFGNLLRGAKRSDLDWVSDFHAMVRKVKFFDYATKSVGKNGPCVPWTVSFALVRYSRKYRFVSRRGPDIERMKHCISMFERRMRWRWLLRNSQQKRCSIRVRREPIACNKHVAPEVEAWLGMVRRSVLGAAARAERS